MIRLLIVSLLFFPSVAAAQRNVTRPSVAILRHAPAEGDTSITNGGAAVLLDGNARHLKSIGGLGTDLSVSSQNKIQINKVSGDVILVENYGDRISVFTPNGEREKSILLKNVNGFSLSEDRRTLLCLTGMARDAQTVFVDFRTGKPMRRLNLGGVALIEDVAGPLFWTVGKQLSAFDANGEISVRRPLTRLPAAPNHPTVINSRNWRGVGVAIKPNEDDWRRRIWVIERDHSGVPGSRDRLFAVDPEGQTRILVELGEIDPTSLACANSRILVVDRKTGDLISFDTDGKLMGREKLGVELVSFGNRGGLWVVGRKSAKRLDPSDLSVLAEFQFETLATPIGLDVR